MNKVKFCFLNFRCDTYPGPNISLEVLCNDLINFINYYQKYKNMTHLYL